MACAGRLTGTVLAMTGAVAGFEYTGVGNADRSTVLSPVASSLVVGFEDTGVDEAGKSVFISLSTGLEDTGVDEAGKSVFISLSIQLIVDSDNFGTFDWVSSNNELLFSVLFRFELAFFFPWSAILALFLRRLPMIAV